MERGKCYLRSGQLPEALEDYRKAMVKDPGNEAAWQGATEILQKSGRQNEASDLWSEGLRKNPHWGGN
jgi:tetratricopeptide (TPR) repeat protein